MSDIVLCTINAKWIHPSLGLRLLKANLGAYEARTEIIEFALRQPLAEKTETLLRARPRILGVSVSIWNHRATAELLDALEARWGADAPRPRIVLGGPEASHLPEGAALFRHADWVIRGEGEAAFRRLVEDILTENEERRRDPPEFINAEPVPLPSIDPAYRLYTEEDLRRKLVYVEASRGCPFGCDFCLSSLDRQVREFPLDEFLAGMETLLRRGAWTIKFLDRTFNLNSGRACRIMEFFLNKIETNASPFCVHFEMIPSRFPPELRALVSRFPPGSLRLELGIQTLNPAVAALIGRPGDPGQELEVLNFLREAANAIVHADLIAGLPGEDSASFANGFDRLWQAASGAGTSLEIQLGILKRLPGTPLARHDQAYGMRYDPAPPYEVQETAALPAPELARIKNAARFWELIMNRGNFSAITAALFPVGQPVFRRFMALADSLLARFGRNWGIDRKDLQAALLVFQEAAD
ncbi:MAG: B12-binding domain-containing radical SAM protein [Treponema sp.]|jgi:radical SAM superfamily enzyme YgiQ (UPF0313 family)|nr:B12-binding domain-containing radical SAM protein [Treponema sp.]